MVTQLFKFTKNQAKIEKKRKKKKLTWQEIQEPYTHSCKLYPTQQSQANHSPRPTTSLTFSNRSGLGIGNTCRLASCSRVRSMFLSFSRTNLYQRTQSLWCYSVITIIKLWFLTSKLMICSQKSFRNLKIHNILTKNNPSKRAISIFIHLFNKFSMCHILYEVPGDIKKHKI